MASPVSLHECPYIGESIAKLDQEVAHLTAQLAARKQFVQSVLGKMLPREEVQKVLDAIVELDITVTPTEEYVERTATRIADFLQKTGLPENRDRANRIQEQIGIVHSLSADLRRYRELLKEITAPPETMDMLLLRSFSQETLGAKFLATYGDGSTPENVKNFDTLPPNRYRSLAESDDTI